MNRLQAHRGPDSAGTWRAADGRVGFAHRRLAIIELTDHGFQPMIADNGLVLVHNGEIYNHVELRAELSGSWRFKSRSDSEVILAAYSAWGDACVERLRGMFAFAIWDPRRHRLFAARDRHGMKPFYYTMTSGRLVFASEIKALLPFLDDIQIDRTGLTEYLTFQFTIGHTTLFRGVNALAPGHRLGVENASVSVRKYWDVRFEPSRSGDIKRFRNDMRGEIEDSVDKHLRADVPVGSHLSGGIDSTLVATLASRQLGRGIEAFHGKFTDFPGYDESQHATAAARHAGMALRQIDIQAEDFIDTIADVVYHLDQPTAGPGSFPQYMVSQLAAEHVKVVLGGQGGDEIFAGYARYLIAYFEQAFKAEMNGGVYGNGFTVKLAALIPNLQVLADYKPLLSMFFSEGLFGDIDQRYFRLVDRFSDLKREVAPDIVDRDYAFELFQSIFNDTEHVCSDVFLDRMTYFDLKTLLPALLQVEDRVSMAHGLESRTPLVDHRIIEFCAQVPAAVRFQDGRLKGLLRDASASALPRATLERPDKMGFPVPLSEWMSGKLGPFIRDLFSARPARERAIFDADAVIGSMTEAAKFSRKHWGLLCLELWHQAFLDRRAEFKVMHVRMAEDPAVTLHDDARGHLREISAPPPRKRKPRSHDAMPTDRSTASTSDGERLQ